MYVRAGVRHLMRSFPFAEDVISERTPCCCVLLAGILRVNSPTYLSKREAGCATAGVEQTVSTFMYRNTLFLRSMSPTAVLRAHDDAATLTSTAEQNDISVSCLECTTGSSIVHS